MPAESPLVAERIGKQLSISAQMKIFMKFPVIKVGRQTLSLHRGRWRLVLSSPIIRAPSAAQLPTTQMSKFGGERSK